MVSSSLSSSTETACCVYSKTQFNFLSKSSRFFVGSSIFSKTQEAFLLCSCNGFLPFFPETKQLSRWRRTESIGARKMRTGGGGAERRGARRQTGALNWARIWAWCGRRAGQRLATREAEVREADDWFEDLVAGARTAR